MPKPKVNPADTSGVSITTARSRSKTYPKKVCAEEGCNVKLSKYNPATHCAEHDNPRDDRFPSRQASSKNLGGSLRRVKARLKE